MLMSENSRPRQRVATASERPHASDMAEAILSLSSDAMLVLSANGEILAANAPAAAMLRYEADLSGRNLAEIGQARPSWAATVAMGGGKQTQPFALRLPDGRTIDCEAAALPEDPLQGSLVRLRDRGQPRHWSDQHVDLAQNARQAGMSAVGTAMAHEINQPLTALLLYLQTMQRLLGRVSGEDAETLAELLGKSIREGQRAGEIVKRIRELAARKEPTRRLVDLEGVIDEALELARAGRSAGVAVDCAYAGVGFARIDAVEIQQILVNLLSNAFDAVSDAAEPCIKLAARRERGMVRIMISDSGPGLAPHLIGKLFQAFESTKANGLGVGLSISQAIAHAHGGDLAVDPGGRGKGAAFTLVLPVGEAGDAHSDGAAKRAPARRPAAQSRAI
jgi:two-component system, LuxR family, sensor kinase FixL